MKEKTCCFTGHRDLPANQIPEIRERTSAVIHKLILDHGICCFYVGGAIGYDTLAAEVLFQLRDEEYPEINVVLAYPFEGYTRRWETLDRERWAPRLYPDIMSASAWRRSSSVGFILQGTDIWSISPRIVLLIVPEIPVVRLIPFVMRRNRTW